LWVLLRVPLQTGQRIVSAAIIDTDNLPIKYSMPGQHHRQPGKKPVQAGRLVITGNNQRNSAAVHKQADITKSRIVTQHHATHHPAGKGKSASTSSTAKIIAFSRDARVKRPTLRRWSMRGVKKA
jgi:hypothetical protein